MRSTFAQFDMCPDANICPVFRDQLADIRPAGKCRHNADFQIKPLTIGQQAEPVAIAFGQTDAIEQRIGFVDVILGIFERIFVTRIIGMERCRHALA